MTGVRPIADTVRPSDGTSIGFQRLGSGPAVIFVHRALNTGESWRTVADTAGRPVREINLDIMGHSHSEALRVVERYHRRDFGHLDVEITFDDPTFYTRPFSIKITQQLLADSDILEYVCNKNEKDRAHLDVGAR